MMSDVRSAAILGLKVFVFMLATFAILGLLGTVAAALATAIGDPSQVATAAGILVMAAGGTGGGVAGAHLLQRRLLTTI